MSDGRPVRTGRRGLTINDVARAAAVSIGTASKALNGTGHLRTETREKVLAAARELGYRPNDLAQSLHRARSMTVGLITNDSFGRFSFPIVEALEQKLADQGIAVFMCNATDDPARERQHLEQLMRKRIDGLIVTARRADKRPALGPLVPGLPIVYVYSQADDDSALCLVPDDEGGARLAVEHLIGLGRKRIAHIAGPERFDAVRLRAAGYRAALAAANLPHDPALSLNGPWSEAWGREAVTTLFDGTRPRPDAIFCDNDQLGRGAIEQLRERGISIPGEVALVGFDNWDVMALAARPPLSSVDMNLSALGHAAGEALLALMAGEERRGIRRLPCSLVIRQSSQDPEGGALPPGTEPK
ncbi:MAG: LacI family transcriptional regulator [Hyphomicrobiales bacterium]|nr:MAG: LacI family transcriptional regulator [Hyphomicrobiales bacterium]